MVHIPLAELDGQLGSLSRDNTHYLICYAGTRAEQALEVARNATPANLPEEIFEDPNGFKPGQQVTVSATDYGTDPVAGELLFAGREALILRRTDERAGTVHVHVPRFGFRIQPA